MASHPVDEAGNPIAVPETAGASGGSHPVDENGNPVTWRDQSWAKTTADVAGYGAAAGIRVLGAVPNLAATVVQGGGLDRAAADQVFAETGGNYSGDAIKAAIPPDQAPWLPSEAAIQGISNLRGAPLEDPNAPSPVKYGGAIAPWVIPGANTMSRIKEAPGLISKGAALAGSTAMGVGDWLASNAAQEYARSHGYGPAVQSLVGFAAPVARGLGFRGAGTVAHAAGGGEEGGPMYDLYREEGQTPPLSEVASPLVTKFQEKLGSTPISTPAKFGFFTGGPHGGMTGAALGVGGRIAASAMDDPSVVRAFAGRGLTTPLIQQYAQRGGLGAITPPQPVSGSALVNSVLHYVPGGG